MSNLNLEKFLSISEDREINEYRILDSLKRIRKKFNSNKLYPELAELRVLAARLETNLEQKSYLKVWIPNKIKNATVKGKEITLDTDTLKELLPDQANNSGLIEWSLMQLYSIIDEGQIIFDFVMENIRIEEVGTLPSNKDIGYFFIPDNKNEILQVNQYECSMGYSAQKPIRSVRIGLIKSIPFSQLNKSPLELKTELLNGHGSISNPAVYNFSTDIDFDFVSTILPVAKKKLVSVI